MGFNQLSLVITESCNAECDICVLSCTPKAGKKMDLQDAFNYIEQVARIESFKTVGITGGEAFLYYDDLFKIIQKSKQHNLRVTVSTNGFWGKEFLKSKNMLNELIHAGLSKLDISVDEFHAKYIPYDNIKNILNVAYEIGFPIALSSVVTKRSSRLKEIACELGESILGFPIAEHPCASVGRARRKISEDEFIYKDGVWKEKCLKQTNLSIFPDGKAYSCCCPTTFNDILSLGSAKQLHIQQLMSNHKSNVYCKLLEVYGAKWFVNVIVKNKLPINLKPGYVALCDLCGDLFFSKDYIDYYRPFIEQEKDNLKNNFKGKSI